MVGRVCGGGGGAGRVDARWPHVRLLARPSHPPAGPACPRRRQQALPAPPSPPLPCSPFHPPARAPQVVLPEGARDVRLVSASGLGLAQDPAFETKYTYLDVVGRPVLVLRADNVVDEMNVPFKVRPCPGGGWVVGAPSGDTCGCGGVCASVRGVWRLEGAAMQQRHPCQPAQAAACPSHCAAWLPATAALLFTSALLACCCWRCRWSTRTRPWASCRSRCCWWQPLAPSLPPPSCSTAPGPRSRPPLARRRWASCTRAEGRQRGGRRIAAGGGSWASTPAANNARVHLAPHGCQRCSSIFFVPFFCSWHMFVCCRPVTLQHCRRRKRGLDTGI